MRDADAVSRDATPATRVFPVAVFVSRIEGKPWSMDVEQHGALRIAS